LVTGAGGFIGSHLVERLVEQGADVWALVRYTSTGGAGWLDSLTARDAVEVVRGDICDFESVRRAMQGRSVVFHLAALIGIPYSYCAVQSYLRTNVEGTLNVLQAARDLKLERLVCTSTSEVYGTARSIPMHEDHPLQSQSPYAASKIAADKLAESFHRSFGLPVSIVRPFNTYGPRQSMRAVIPTIIAQSLAGSEVRIGSLTPRRDFNYVSDTVDGFLSCAAQEQAIGKTIHFGSGEDINIEELAQVIARLLHKEIRLVAEEQRTRPKDSEVGRLCADATLARQLLGWQPRVGLEEGLRQTIEWMANHLASNRVNENAV
jgi:dTDP-glucose 4,6-dehydratase